MKCSRVEDWYEKNGDAPSDAGLQDILAHARSCPDCATVMTNRAVILETMREMPVPEVPRDLAARIAQVIDLEEGETDDPESAPNIIDSLIEGWLRPAQYTLAAACLATLVWIGMSEFPGQAPARQQTASEYASARLSAERAKEQAAPAREKALSKLSDADVAAFLRKLNDYRRSHPEMDDARSGAPGGMLAADR